MLHYFLDSNRRVLSIRPLQPGVHPMRKRILQESFSVRIREPRAEVVRRMEKRG